MRMYVCICVRIYVYPKEINKARRTVTTIIIRRQRTNPSVHAIAVEKKKEEMDGGNTKSKNKIADTAHEILTSR